MLSGFLAGEAFAQDSHNVRSHIVITADPELDDNNSLIRLLLYSSEMQIAGLILSFEATPGYTPAATRSTTGLVGVDMIRGSGHCALSGFRASFFLTIRERQPPFVGIFDLGI